MPPYTAIIVVNYGTAELTQKAVNSVFETLESMQAVEIHLIDNASPGEDRILFETMMQDPLWQQHVTFYPEDTNHGFGRGNNCALKALAAREHPPEMVFFLNPDAQLENDAIDTLKTYIRAHPKVAFAGASVCQPTSGPVVAAFRFPGFISEITSTIGFGPLMRLARTWQVPLQPDHPQGPVGWVTGAAVMARFDVLQQIGFFDPGFFLYYEEVELMRRAHRAGWQAHYVPEARVLHAEGVATGVKSDQPERRPKPAYWYNSWAYYFTLDLGRFGAGLLSLTVLLGAVLHFALSALRRKKPSLPLNFMADFWAHAAWPILSRKSLAS